MHQYIASETGGSVGVRDEGLLESALQGAFATFDGKELYPTKIEKAARICASLVGNHAFLDGNKRIGMYVMLTFLEVNGLRVECSDADIVKLNIPTATPYVFEFDDNLNLVNDYYLADPEELKRKQEAVANQGKAK